MTQENNDRAGEQNSRKIDVFGRSFALPRSRLMRVIVGVALVIGGILGFLPVLGFWMIPLGLLVLSHDSRVLRRFRRRIALNYGRWRAGRVDK